MSRRTSDKAVSPREVDEKGLLRLHDADLYALPPWLEAPSKHYAKSVRTVELKKNHLGSLPDVSGLTHLVTLDVNRNAIRGVLSASGLLPPSLEHLHASGNQLSGVEADVLTALPRLAAADNLAKLGLTFE